MAPSSPTAAPPPAVPPAPRRRYSPQAAPVVPQRAQAVPPADAQLVELHELTLLCQAEYGQRPDIEWAFADGRLYLLQCRGITR